MLLGFVTFTLLIVEEHLIGHCIDKPSFWDWWIMKEDCCCCGAWSCLRGHCFALWSPSQIWQRTLWLLPL